MNSSKALSVALKDRVRAQIGLWNYQATSAAEINQHDSFRELLTARSPLCELDTQYRNQIIVRLGEQRYHSSISKDFFNNYIRICKLFEVCTKSDGSKKLPAAWNLVTSYYMCFFCAVEFLRLNGHHVLFLLDEDIEIIRSISSTSTGVLEQGSYTTRTTLDPIDGFQITIKKVNIRHHQYVWDNFKSLLRGALRGIKELSESDRSKILKTIGDDSKCIPRPSDIRNTWNYRDANLFAEHGERVANPYSKLIKSYSSSSEWFERSSTSNEAGHLACGLSFLCHSLREAIEKTKPYIVK
jgi:hypothetical protein